ncbi:MAG: RdgB/HAM1 family non-canonical purine NTP pyrophosphatase [Polyangiales bacterium]|nr:RdgB/HAM1 family non-canonical purine NTP pyrophosphatase [Sandaracinaceae bacterium]
MTAVTDTARELLLATGNPNKVREVREVLEPLGFRVVGLADLYPAGDLPEEPVEDGDTFEANARLKAVGYARLTGRACVAEDSGLEVDALGGAPGVHSARYAGVDGDRETRDSANNDKLLAALRDVPRQARTARFVAAICLVDAEGKVQFEARGTYEGVVADAPRGTGGFGYDPLLFLPDVGLTSAELSPAEKNARSHRGAAVRALATHLAGSARR